MSGPRAVYLCEGLVKRREASGAAFELRVPRLRIHAGEVVVLCGASGCGKSTLLDLLALALEPDSAALFRFRAQEGSASDVRLLWQRRDLDELARLRGLYMGYVLQTGGLLPFLTARENIALSCRLLGQDPKARVERLGHRLRIADQLDKLPRQLSVGERQRVAIARAMAHRPGVVLADEPTASVDPLNAQAVLELFLDLVRQDGITAIIAAHEWPSDSIPGARVLNHRLERDGSVTRSLFWS